eukprot:scaffold22575_cov141-Cylindrotheca_fusiformis.AAC.17
MKLSNTLVLCHVVLSDGYSIRPNGGSHETQNSWHGQNWQPPQQQHQSSTNSFETDPQSTTVQSETNSQQRNERPAFVPQSQSVFQQGRHVDLDENSNGETKSQQHDERPAFVPQSQSVFQQGRQADLDENRNGEMVGDYKLIDDDPKASSGKSLIYQGLDPSDNKVIVKLSDRTDALKREAENYEIFSETDLFVQLHEYDEENGALIMERGELDLKTFLEENGPLKGWDLQYAAYTAAQCVAAVHDQGMVWTEVKAPNFVLAESNEHPGKLVMKGIDLESVVPNKASPIDFSPYACPPEFALPFLTGKEKSVEMDAKFDIWSLGMLFYKLSKGHHYFDTDKEDNITIAQRLRKKAEGYDGWKERIQADQEIDPDMKDLIQVCLSTDPQDRPSVHEIMEHPFFQK